MLNLTFIVLNGFNTRWPELMSHLSLFGSENNDPTLNIQFILNLHSLRFLGASIYLYSAWRTTVPHSSLLYPCVVVTNASSTH